MLCSSLNLADTGKWYTALERAWRAPSIGATVKPLGRTGAEIWTNLVVAPTFSLVPNVKLALLGLEESLLA